MSRLEVREYEVGTQHAGLQSLSVQLDLVVSQERRVSLRGQEQSRSISRRLEIVIREQTWRW